MPITGKWTYFDHAAVSPLSLPADQALQRWRERCAEAAQAAYKEAGPVIDSMINKGIVTKNKAARHKSRLNKRVKELSA